MNRYLRNAWYMAAWADEVTKSGMTREILGRRVFLYRLTDGRANALLDRCPHRFAPISLGTREGDTLVCGYHGLAFAPDGTCVHNPFNDRIPKGAQIQNFAVSERDGIIWLWGGSPDSADSSLIPDFSFVPDTPQSRSVKGVSQVNANYEYLTDNLMDLSHLEFVHRGSFGGYGVMFHGKFAARQEGQTLHSDWWVPNIDPPPSAFGVPPDAKADHWLDMRWNAPASMRLDVGFVAQGAPRETGAVARQAHIVTPKNEHESHYFWSSSRGYAVDSKEVDAEQMKLFVTAFDVEDKPMIEAAYDNVRGKDFWDEKPASIGIDQGGTRTRRLLEEMMQREAPQTAG